MLFLKIYYISFFEKMLPSASTETRVLAYIMRHMGYDNYVYIRYKDVADVIGRCDDTVGNVIRNLEECDFLRQNGPNRYMINPTCIHKGPKDRCENLSKEFFNIFKNG